MASVEAAVGARVEVAVGKAGVTTVDVMVGTGVRVAAGDMVGKGVKVNVEEGTGEAGVTPGGSVAEGGGAAFALGIKPMPAFALLAIRLPAITKRRLVSKGSLV